MQYPEPSLAAGICRTVPCSRNMPNSPAWQEYAIFIDAERTHSPAAGSSPYSP